MGLKVLVTGGRDYSNKEKVYDVLGKIHKDKGIVELCHGAARGADDLANLWAVTQDVPRRVFPVSSKEWNTLGKKAGVLRNQRMLEEFKPDLIVEFPGGTGTHDMVARGKRNSIPIRTVIDLNYVPKKKRKK